MPSVINPRSGPFPVYTSTSPPTVDVGIFTIAKTGVNLKAAGSTAIFTVPAGREYLAVLAYAKVTAVTSGGAGTQSLALSESGSSQTMIPAGVSASNTPIVGRVYTADVRASSFTSATTCLAGNNVLASIATSHAGSNVVTGTVFATGFYVT